jgi:hypothetical protein
MTVPNRKWYGYLMWPLPLPTWSLSPKTSIGWHVLGSVRYEEVTHLPGLGQRDVRRKSSIS